MNNKLTSILTWRCPSAIGTMLRPILRPVFMLVPMPALMPVSLLMMAAGEKRCTLLEIDVLKEVEVKKEVEVEEV